MKRSTRSTGNRRPRTPCAEDSAHGVRRLRFGGRRGLSLVVVMIAISMSMALTYAALSSQARGVQVRQNVKIGRAHV